MTEKQFIDGVTAELEDMEILVLIMIILFIEKINKRFKRRYFRND